MQPSVEEFNERAADLSGAALDRIDEEIVQKDLLPLGREMRRVLAVYLARAARQGMSEVAVLQRDQHDTSNAILPFHNKQKNDPPSPV